MAGKKICNIDDLYDFGNLDELMKQSGIVITNASSTAPKTKEIKHEDKTEEDDEKVASDLSTSSKLDLGEKKKPKPTSPKVKKILPDPFADVMGDPMQPEVKSEKDLDNCLICCNPLYMKLTLPCGHCFCFNCIKGQIIRSGRSQPIKCSVCDKSLPDHFIDKIKKKPHLLDSIEFNPSYLENLQAYWFYASKDRSW